LQIRNQYSGRSGCPELLIDDRVPGEHRPPRPAGEREVVDRKRREAAQAARIVAQHDDVVLVAEVVVEDVG
jgi:hypothetical protein